MAIIRNLVVKIGADISSLSKGLGAVQNRLNKFSRSLTSIGTSLTMKVIMPLVLLAKQSLQTSAQFEQSMANAASVSGATGEELQNMTELARHMGKTTVFPASQAADAMYYMASVGYKAEQMANAIEPILNLAAATEMAAKQINTMQGSAKLMKSMMEEVAISIGDVMKKLINVL